MSLVTVKQNIFYIEEVFIKLLKYVLFPQVARVKFQ